MAIMAVPLDGLAAGFPNSMLKRGHGLLLRRRCARHVENFFFQNCAVQIVHAIAE